MRTAMPARPLHLAWRHLEQPPVEWFVGRADVVHGTNFVVPPTRRAARVVTVHDLTTVRFPEMCDEPTLRFPALIRRAVAQGAWVHTPSQYVADEVVAELGVDKTRVVPSITAPRSRCRSPRPCRRRRHSRTCHYLSRSQAGSHRTRSATSSRSVPLSPVRTFRAW